MTPFERLLELVPHTLPRRKIYRKALCQKCGRVDLASLDEGDYRLHLAQIASDVGLVRVPGATVASASGRDEIEKLALNGIVFEPVDFPQLLELAR